MVPGIIDRSLCICRKKLWISGQHSLQEQTPREGKAPGPWGSVTNSVLLTSGSTTQPGKRVPHTLFLDTQKKIRGFGDEEHKTGLSAAVNLDKVVILFAILGWRFRWIGVTRDAAPQVLRPIFGIKILRVPCVPCEFLVHGFG
ncbi:hypothetical protein EYR41_011257 [Orbilia oligospora]|uniref:Uncharacterized protein n=1 Tax=Orbilia oligospora TaxID=2813651 RepID=A0A7C8K2E9_ORBOL|nr:hypothetical protein TWF751_000480 [Orbilia oligospora]TGJ63327.1 hypothetical protein EYR41_011257 [Orbilia oligospora]